MSTPGAVAEAGFDAWNPGISSQIPEVLRPLSTILRPEHVFTGVAQAREMRDLTGLGLPDLVSFRPARLALHELLVRVTADLSVPDGTRIEDLGINFRQITRTLLASAIAPHAAEVEAAYAAVRTELRATIDAALGRMFDAPIAAGPKPRGGFLRNFFPRDSAVVARDEAAGDEQSPEQRLERLAATAPTPLQHAAYRALTRVVGALVVRHGRLWGSREIIGALATDLACNQHASDVIGDLIDPWVRAAALEHGYALLPRQDEPVVMNTKGASASGKSTLRPLQKRLAADIGVRWTEFALISPDIWRKQLLDYSSLGDAYRYAGAFTGEELQIVDQKLDRYMARKAARGEMSHLLIDRFRFDSFAADSDEAGSNLLTRFGRHVYLFFMITPPAALVERAWNRGLEVGRYKAVDDTLAHGIEAYTGMPELFFTWVRRRDKRVHFEFLDNSVAAGHAPCTVAFGWNETLNVLDVSRLLDVERFRRVDVDATRPDAIYREPALLAASRNTAFLRQCVDRFETIRFAQQSTGRIYLELRSGHPTWADPVGLREALADDETCAGIAAVAPDAIARDFAPDSLRFIDPAEHSHTVGAWGRASS